MVGFLTDLGIFFGGLGIFFMGVSALQWAGLQAKAEKKQVSGQHVGEGTGHSADSP